MVYLSRQNCREPSSECYTQFNVIVDLKGTVQREFRPPVFFIIHCPIGLKIFEFDHTARRFEKIRISRRKRNQIQNYFNPFEPAQAGSNDEKKTFNK